MPATKTGTESGPLFREKSEMELTKPPYRMAVQRKFGFLAFVALILTGCGTNQPNGQKPVYPVIGKVLVNDKPAVNARILFHPLDEQDAKVLRPSAIVDSDGSFRLTTYSANDGAPAGEYAITIVWRAPAKSGDYEEGPDRLHGRFADLKKPVTKIVIEARPNELKTIELK